MQKNRLFLIWTILFSLVVLSACLTSEANHNAQLNIGYGSGFLSSPIYAADYDVNLHQFASSADVVYGLAGGSLDAGFLEINRFIALIESNTTFLDRLTIAGTIDYPFGATLIIREDLAHLRLQDMNGLNFGVTSPSSHLLAAFLDDADRLGIETDKIHYTFMPFRTMIPALSEGEVDAVIIRGDYAIVGLEAGHHILYQNWQLEPGDACCPGIVDQAAKVLLVRQGLEEDIEAFVEALLATRQLQPSAHREAVAQNTNLPLDLLGGMPVAEFSLADDGLIDIFVFNRNEHYHYN